MRKIIIYIYVLFCFVFFFPHGFLKRRFSRRERPKKRKYAPSMRGRRSRADAKNVVSCCIGSTNKTKIGGLRTPFQLLSLSSFEANTCFFSSFLELHSDPSNYGIFAYICLYLSRNSMT